MSELLRAILADPDDEALQLVYADALQAVGDPRGELIVTEHRMLAAPTPALRARRRELRKAHGAAWWPELPTHSVRTRCGFADALAVEATELATIGSILAREPVRELELYGASVDAEVIAQLPAVRRLTARPMAPSGLEALLASPVGDTLESLDIAGAPIHGVDVGDRLPACRRLVLARGGFWLDDLFGWHHIGALRELDISVSDIDEADLAALLARTHALVHLRASGNLFGDDGARAIASKLPQVPHLATLEVIGCGISPQGIAALREAGPALAVTNEIANDVRAIDLVGSMIELVPHGDGDWALYVDGERRRIRFGVTESTSIERTLTQRRRDVEVAHLDDVANAIALGWPRELIRTGAQVEAHEQPETQIMTALITLRDSPEPIEVDLDYYVD